MPALQGNLRFMPCRDLLLYLGNRGVSGTFSVRLGSRTKSIVVRAGAAAGAASNEPREYLGQLLINVGKITEEQFTRAYETQLQTGVPLGQILTMIGAVSELDVRAALKTKIRETALEVCAWDEGAFEFELISVMPDEETGVLEPVPLIDICREADERAAAWTRIRAKLPEDGAGLVVAPSSGASEQDAALFALLREGRSLAEIQLHLRSTKFHLYLRVVELLEQGALVVAGPGAAADEVIDLQPDDEALDPAWFPEEVAPEVTPAGPELLANAREALQAGRHEEAERLALRAVEYAATPEAQQTLKEAESALLLRLRDELLRQPRVPSVALERARIKALPLSPPERYLLARMDGSRPLASLVRVCPLRELDALKLVRKFLGEGLIHLE